MRMKDPPRPGDPMRTEVIEAPGQPSDLTSRHASILWVWRRSADPQVVDALDRGATGAADERVAIAAEQRIGNGPGTGRAVEFGGGLNWFGHDLIISV